jgi:hypothetical protein
MGFLAANRIGPLKNDMDVDVTFEGANPVMMQQVCWLTASPASLLPFAAVTMQILACVHMVERFWLHCQLCHLATLPAGGQGAAGLGATRAAAPVAGGVTALGCTAGGLQSAAPLQVSMSLGQACG